MTTIQLNEIELQLAITTAMYRQRGKPEGGSYKGENHLLINIYGALGEIAFGKAINRMPDFSIRQKDNGYDFKVMGFRFDVKTSANLTAPRLIVNFIDAGRVMDYCDYYILANVFNTNMDKVELIGWATRKLLLARDPVKLNNREVFIVENQELFKIETLINNITENDNRGNH